MTPEPGTTGAPDSGSTLIANIDTAVIGGGWAGLAAAVELTQAGCVPTLFETAPALGGRARSVRLTLAGREIELDNGQHLLIGAYREWLRIAALVGADGPDKLVRAPLELVSTDGLRLAAWPLPAPLNLAAGLVSARGLAWRERLAMLRLIHGLRRAGWQVPPGETVEALLERTGQPPSLRARLWEPLAIAALNTDAAQACARTFAAVLRDSFGAHARASDFLLPAATLSQLLPEPARAWLEARGARIALRTTVRALAERQDRWLLDTSRGSFLANRVVLALPPFAASRLLAQAAGPGHRGLLAALERFEYESIATVYLGWRGAPAPALPRWIMLDEHAAPQAWGQWLFDRGTQAETRIAAVVVSARGRHAQVSPGELGAGIARQVATQLAIRPADDARTVVEKRATFRCTPWRPVLRPDAFAAGAQPGSAFARLALAGDYACPDYPATLESAVRSGVGAARLLLA